MAREREVVSTMPEKSPKAHLGSFTVRRPSLSLRRKAYLDLAGNTKALLVMVVAMSENRCMKPSVRVEVTGLPVTSAASYASSNCEQRFSAQPSVEHNHQLSTRVVRNRVCA
jgi:hypothetical protein